MKKQLNNRIKIETSWDDGHPLDLKLAQVLLKYEVPATFYLPIRNIEGRPTLDKRGIKELGKNFRIGAHTYSHEDLTGLSNKKVREEIVTGKEELEQILGREITLFCYPRGKFNQKIKKMVKSLGFKSARTARMYCLSEGEDSFAKNPHLHFYQHNLLVYIAHLFKNRDLLSLSKLPLIYNPEISEMAENQSRYVLGNKMHIWGHSWEIYENNLIKDLENLLERNCGN